MDVTKIAIVMSERRPISIVEADWPVVARVEQHDGEVRSNANRIQMICVRQHADGRRIVYGRLYAGWGGMPAGWRGADAGFMVDAWHVGDDETLRAIRRVAGIIGDASLADQCIAELPGEEVV